MPYAKRLEVLGNKPASNLLATSWNDRYGLIRGVAAAVTLPPVWVRSRPPIMPQSGCLASIARIVLRRYRLTESRLAAIAMGAT